ncbi:MAG: S-layer homology domain-containing protein, partial [Pseudoflavonifractor sp.]
PKSAFTATLAGEVAVVEIPPANMKKLLESEKSIILDLSELAGASAARLPAAFLGALGQAVTAASGTWENFVLVFPGQLTMTLDRPALAGLSAAAKGGEVTLHAATPGVEALTPEQQFVLQGWQLAELYELSATGADGKPCADFGNGKATLRVPISSATDPFSVLYLPSSGGEEPMTAELSTQDSASYLQFATPHFSTFAVVRGDWKSPFRDVNRSDWFWGDVQYVYQHRLMDGLTDSSFAPEATATRAMAVTLLWRLAGAPEPLGDTPFEDVAADQWYTKAVRWANERKIVAGVSPDRFAPAQVLTREQCAVLLQRYAAQGGATASAPTAERLSAYRDGGEISPFALPAMGWAVDCGVLGGQTADLLAPQAPVKRGELAAMLHRFAQQSPGPA